LTKLLRALVKALRLNRAQELSIKPALRYIMLHGRVKTLLANPQAGHGNHDGQEKYVEVLEGIDDLLAIQTIKVLQLLLRFIASESEDRHVHLGQSSTLCSL
jgi:hypothetical protein